jgi:hypothetical protein
MAREPFYGWEGGGGGGGAKGTRTHSTGIPAAESKGAATILGADERGTRHIAAGLRTAFCTTIFLHTHNAVWVGGRADGGRTGRAGHGSSWREK